MAAADFLAALRALRGGEVEFVVVGGLAAVLNGAPINNALNLDIVHERSPDNVEKLVRALDSIDAVYRMQLSHRLRPNTRDLNSAQCHNLTTRYGPLDVLGTIGKGKGYAQLLPHSNPMEIGEGVRVPVLNLETIVALKEELAGEKDLAVLPVLRRTLEERRRPKP
jgi:hypothetical protein